MCFTTEGTKVEDVGSHEGGVPGRWNMRDD